VYGMSRNPWNLDRTPGGSSGGAAAAVAAGLTPLELCSDIGGSIRVPSHFNGVYGLKPSWGIVSGRGNIPPMPGARGNTPLGVYGPIARSAFDLEFVLDIIAGADELDRKAWSVRLPPARHDRLSDFRVGLWLDAYTVDDGYRVAIEAFVEELEKIGVRISRDARPEIDPAQSHDIYLATLMALMGAGAPAEDYEAQVEAGRLSQDREGYAAIFGRYMSQSVRDLGRVNDRRDALIASWGRFFESYDLLICPIYPCVAFPHDTSGDGHMAQYGRRLPVSGQSIPYLDGLKWPSLVTVAELPAVATPTGRLVGGLPAGVQVIGPRLEDRTPLRFVQLVERELPGYLIPPMAL
jgi:amidase